VTLVQLYSGGREHTQVLRAQLLLTARVNALPSTQADLSPFFGTAAPVLVAFLITWLAAESRTIREQAISRASAGQNVGFHIEMPVIALLLAAGACVALRVEARGHAAEFERVAVWASLGLGFASVAISVTQAAAASGEDLKPVVRVLGVLKLWVPVLAALIFGVLASPLVRTTTAVTGAKFQIYGTCISGGCGLRIRSGPGPQFPEVAGAHHLADGTHILVRCQIRGRPPQGFRSAVWDQIGDGRYVSDAFVRTPNRKGGFSAELAVCSKDGRQGAAG
jgi:hypothetical protein